MPARGPLALVVSLLLSGCSLLFSPSSGADTDAGPDAGPCTPPAIVGTVNTEAAAVVAVGEYAYVGAWSGGVDVLEIADPATPSSCGYLDFEADDVVDSFAVVGEAIYFTKREYGLWKLTFAANPCAPTEHEVASGSTLFDVIRCEGFLCTAAAGATVNVHTEAGELERSIPLEGYDDVVRLAWSGDYVLAATDWGDDLVAVNFSTGTTSPTTVTQQVADVAVAGNLVVVAAGPDGIVVLDGARLPQLRRRSEVSTTGSDAFAVAFDGRWAFVCSDFDEEGTYWLDVFDLAAPANPVLAHAIQLEDECIDLDLTADDVLVAADSRLHIVDRGCAR